MSILKALTEKSGNFKGFLGFILSTISSSWMSYLNRSLKKISDSICFSFFWYVIDFVVIKIA